MSTIRNFRVFLYGILKQVTTVERRSATKQRVLSLLNKNHTTRTFGRHWWP